MPMCSASRSETVESCCRNIEDAQFRRWQKLFLLSKPLCGKPQTRGLFTTAICSIGFSKFGPPISAYVKSK